MSDKNNTDFNMPKYESDIYYGVVIRGENFKGWHAPYVGFGRMKFTHSEHGDFIVNKGDSINWMRECWDDFIEFVSNIENKSLNSIFNLLIHQLVFPDFLLKLIGVFLFVYLFQQFVNPLLPITEQNDPIF